MDRTDLLQSINENVISNEIVSKWVAEHTVKEGKFEFPEEWIKIIYNKSIRDYLLDFLFFVFRVLFLIFLPIVVLAIISYTSDKNYSNFSDSVIEIGNLF